MKISQKITLGFALIALLILTLGVYAVNHSVHNNVKYGLEFLIALALLSVIMLRLIIHKNVIVPLNKIAQTAQRVTKGDMHASTGYNAKNEIGEVSRKFDLMVQELRNKTVSKNYVDNILNSLEEAVIIIDPKTSQIIDANSEAESLLELSKIELLKMKIIDMDPEVNNISLWNEFLNQFGIGTIKLVERELTRKDQSHFTVEINAKLIEDYVNHYPILLATVRDITERKLSDANMQDINQELRRSEKATLNMLMDLQSSHQELKQTQTVLLQSEKMASIGQLAAGVAHEINNPIGFVSSNIQSLEQYIAAYKIILNLTDEMKNAIQEADLEKAKSIVDSINKIESDTNIEFIKGDIENLILESQRGIDRVKKIVMDLKTFAREDKETKEILNINDIIEGVINIVHNEIKYKAEMIKTYDEKIPDIPGYGQKLGQVFINLLVNAAQSIDGNGTITIKTYQQGSSVCVDISDTGHGIGEKDVGKIFDPFYTTKPVGQGTGLGLSICYDIIKLHGGDITVESKVNEGTIFKVKLPVEDKETNV